MILIIEKTEVGHENLIDEIENNETLAQQIVDEYSRIRPKSEFWFEYDVPYGAVLEYFEELEKIEQSKN